MTRSTPPPATNLLALSGDLLAVAAKRIVEQIACAPTFEPMQQLKDALDVYESVRIGEVLNDSDVIAHCAMVSANEPAPPTRRSEVRT